MAVDLERIRAALADRVPEGYDVANLVLVPVHATAEVEEIEARPRHDKAEMPLMDEAGRPTRLKIDAWMAHADVPNLNRQMFMAEDLEKFASGFQTMPDYLVMDWNHSAVMPWRDGPKAIGAWHDVRWERDPAASNGRGAMGLRATGIQWAWLFPEQANILMGEQARNGYAAFSMAAIAKRKSYQTDPATGQEVTILHEPVFFTLSALDVLPADPDARGHVSMANAAPAAKPSEEASMPQSDVDKVIELTEALTLSEQTVKTLEEEIAGLKGTISTLEATVAERDTALAEMTTNRDALVAEAETTTQALADALEKLTAMTAQLDEIRVAKEAEESARTLAARLESLPESFRTAHASRSEEQRTKIEEKWKALSDAEWEEYKAEELLFGFEKASLRYTERSNAEGGRLPQGGTAEVDLKSRAKRITK